MALYVYVPYILIFQKELGDKKKIVERKKRGSGSSRTNKKKLFQKIFFCFCFLFLFSFQYLKKINPL